VVAPGSPGLAEIRELFGNEIVDSDGLLDRKLLRQVVFGDDEQRRKLEEITHPRIRDAAIAQAEAVQHPYLIMVVPLLVESPMKALMDRILVVDCTEQTQLTRLLARDAEDEAQARRIIASQASREQRLKIADDVVQNDGTPLDVQAAVEVLHQQYLALSSQKRP
jgi:dephospho-CoA kinase